MRLKTKHEPVRGILIRGGQFTTDSRLDRVRRPDLRDLNYPAYGRGALRLAGEALRSRTHRLDVYNDQGQEGACVGFGWGHELASTPMPIEWADGPFSREQIYWPAQRSDQWDGGAYPGAAPFYEGTEVRAGADVLVKMGYAEQYRWLFSVQEIAAYIGNQAPVVIGVDWYQGMFDPDADGFLRPTGQIRGGHCTLLVGVRFVKVRKAEKLAWTNVDWAASYFVLHNSWGADWGEHGRAKISFIDMATLVPGGDFCVLIKRHRPKVH